MDSLTPFSGRTRVLFVHNKLTPFVRLDRDLLAQRYQVEEFAVLGRLAPLRTTWQALRRTDVVVYWFASAHSLLPVVLARLMRRPVVGIVGGYDTANLPAIGYGHQRGGLKKHVARLTMALSTRLITNSRYTGEEAAREAGVPPHKITVVYHGVPHDAQQSAVADGPRVDKDPALVLTVGNVDRPNLWRKGLEPFVRSASLLPDCRFMLVGAWLDGAADHLRAIAPPNVTLAGALPDAELHGLFERAAVYVQASAHEGFGLALAEAMARGCVPVVTRAGALPEVVAEAGVYASSPSPRDLAAAITAARASAPALSPLARQRVAGSFGLAQRGDGLAAVVEAVRGAHGAAGREGGSRRPGVAGDGAAGAAPFGGGDEWPLVSVVIPTRNEERDIPACLAAVLSQDYPPQRIEVLVVDGGSTDRTREIVRRAGAADLHGRVRLIDNPQGLAAPALNLGLRACAGEAIVRVDGHTIIAPDYVRRCVETLRDTGADNVGGLMRPRGRGYVGRCIALATSSRFGIGNSRFHYDEHGGEVETVYLGCFRRSILERVGLFDESLVRNQDDELNDRIIAAGGRIWLSPAIHSTYYNRGSYRALWRQYHEYGYWKVRVLLRHRHAMRPRHLAPALLVLALGSAPAFAVPLLRHRAAPHRSSWQRAFLRFLACGAWALYGAASLSASVLVARRDGWFYLPGLLPAFGCLHLGYGSGFVRGLIDAARRSPAFTAEPRIPTLGSLDPPEGEART